MAAISLALFAAVDAGAQTAPPDPLTQAQKDGCQRNVAGLLTRTSPEWTYVYNTPADQSPPAPRWAWGVASSGSPHLQATHTSGGDLPQGHAAYDFNVNLLVDAPYQYLLGGNPVAKTGNYAGSDDEETGRLHTEWEDLTIPRFAWAEPGDRIGMLGSWVWDCGHFGTPFGTFSPDNLSHGCEGLPDVVPATPQCPLTGEKTEFHPYRAVWVQRAQASASPYGENQADMFVSTDQTPAGQMADCAHKHPPPPGAPSYGPDYTACLDSEPNWQDVSGHYSFLLPLPPQPSPTAQLRFRAIDRGSVGAPPPALRREGNGVRVTFDLSSRPSQRIVSAYTFFAGWTQLAPPQLPTHLRVRYDQLVVHRAMDPGCTLGLPLPPCSLQSTRTTQLTTAPGEWDLYLDASGVWSSWGPGGGEFLTQDGQSFSGDQTVDLYVPPGKGWRLYVHGRECDVGGIFPQRPLADCPSDHEIADDNDVPGAIVDTYPSPLASLGTHTSDAQTAAKDPTSTCPDANPHGCYSLTYTVSLVNDQADRAAQLDSTSQLALACSKRKLTLIDVHPQGKRVLLHGAADSSLIGKRVYIVFNDRITVAKAIVGSNGLFSAAAPLPPAKIRNTNRARYLARVANERSLDLKLTRRVILESLISRQGRLTITGRVIPPLARPPAVITVQQVISCKKTATVKRIKPRNNGRFRVALTGPANVSAAVYRLSTKVRKVASNPKLFPTFSLPEPVALR